MSEKTIGKQACPNCPSQGFIFTNKEERDKREATCTSCSSKNGIQCGECGCFLMFLRKIQSASCPLNKW
jgi:hypothetical protein